jgi:hypothetical protein
VHLLLPLQPPLLELLPHLRLPWPQRRLLLYQLQFLLQLLPRSYLLQLYLQQLLLRYRKQLFQQQPLLQLQLGRQLLCLLLLLLQQLVPQYMLPHKQAQVLALVQMVQLVEQELMV